MKKIATTFILLAFSVSLLSKNTTIQYRTVPQSSFGKGEHLEYLVHMGILNAGIATIDVDSKLYLVNNRPCYRIDTYGTSTGALESVTKIRDFWRSYVDTGAIQTQKFYRNLLEGNYKKEETTVFNVLQKTAQIKDEKGTRNFATPEGMQDMVSGFYFIRTLPLEKYTKGAMIKISGALESEVHNLDIEYLGEQEVKCSLGKINCYVLSPIVPDNQLFSGRRPVKVFVSADKNRVPVLIKAEFVVGTAEIELKVYKNLKHALNFRK